MVTISAADLSAADSHNCEIAAPNKSNATKEIHACNTKTQSISKIKKIKKTKSTRKNYFGLFKLLIPYTLR